MENTNIKKPCVVETPQGFSVSYKERLLYSKYNPAKLINSQIDQMEILPGTIFLCNSPALCYGLEPLLKKLAPNCLIFLCEGDNLLRDFTIDSSIYKKLSNTNSYKSLLFFPTVEELYNLPLEIFKIAQKGQYRRVIGIDFSGGTAFNEQLYKNLEDSCRNSVKTFWTNRLTLTKFGRKYSHNFFSNLRRISSTTALASFFNKVSKPIIVAGAGESVDCLYEKIKNRRDDFFILCVDTILSSFIDNDIIPDGVFVEEAQIVISKAFICEKHNVQLFAGLSSLPILYDYFKPENISYFATEFTSASFINKLKNENLLPPVNPPFGSVGLTAVYYSLRFRKDNSVPIFVTGLDFSYSVGPTHGKGTIAHKGRLASTNKIVSLENYGAAFSQSSLKFTGKDGRTFITTPALSSYGLMFNNLFGGTENIYDMADGGMELGLVRGNLPEAGGKVGGGAVNITKSPYSIGCSNSLNIYLENEVKELKELRKLLTEKTKLSKDELKDKITKIAAEKEYLYLHFPDGYCFNYNQSFLNRIRTEIDFFLKIFD